VSGRNVQGAKRQRGETSCYRVQHDCRRNYTSKRRYEQQQAANNLRDTEPSSSKMLRSSSQAFNWKTHCFFCGETCNLDKNAHRVETLEIRDSILYQCKARADAWAIEVQGCLTNCCDLVAEEALYHKNCHRNFYCSYVYSVPGRPTDNVKHLHLSHGFQCSPTLNRQPYEGRLPLTTSWWRKSSNMTVGQSSLIYLAHHCYN